MKTLTRKQRNQVKSRWYYIFWGTATASVVLGQFQVGNGYRQMVDSIEQIKIEICRNLN